MQISKLFSSPTFRFAAAIVVLPIIWTMVDPLAVPMATLAVTQILPLLFLAFAGVCCAGYQQALDIKKINKNWFPGYRDLLGAAFFGAAGVIFAWHNFQVTEIRLSSEPLSYLTPILPLGNVALLLATIRIMYVSYKEEREKIEREKQRPPTQPRRVFSGVGVSPSVNRRQNRS